MKEFNIRHVQHHLAEVLDAVERGEKVRITRRGKVVAQLGPPEPAGSTLRWPDSAARFERMTVQSNHGPPVSQTIEQDRQERF